MYYYFKEGRTFGYKILGMQIVSLKTGEKLSQLILLARLILKLLIIILLNFAVIGILITGIMIAITSKKQSPYDMVVKTIVVIKEKQKNNWIVWITLVLFIILVVSFVLILNFLSTY